MKTAFVFVLGLCLPVWLLFCTPTIMPIHPTLDDAAYVDADDLCAQACAKLENNNCPVGANIQCTPRCRIDQAQGVGSQLNPSCILSATSRDAMAACGVSCP
jgi:hypothetical protein